jgi:class 3 adenylate cyclase
VRYLKASFVFGFVASVLVAGLLAAGAFNKLDFALWLFLGKKSGAPVSGGLLQYALVILLGYGASWITIDIGRPLWKFFISGALLLEILFLPVVMNAHGHFFSPFAPTLALVLGATGGLLYSRSEAGKRKRLLSLTFGERISRKAFNALVDSEEPLDFSGQKREVSILLCEVFNHDELMDSLQTSDYVAMSNLFLQSGSEYLVENGAFLDECDGESLRVVFGAPVKDETHCASACKCALGLAAVLDELNQTCQQRWQKQLDFRIAIHSAPMILAAYGSQRLGTFGVAGEAVDFARRLCAANVFYGTRLMISSSTLREALQGIEVRPIELIANGEEIYELLGLKNCLSDEDLFRRDLFWKGVILFREKKWEQALEHFRSALPTSPDQEKEAAPIRFYIQRVEQVLAGMPALDWQHQPGAKW